MPRQLLSQPHDDELHIVDHDHHHHHHGAVDDDRPGRRHLLEVDRRRVPRQLLHRAARQQQPDPRHTGRVPDRLVRRHRRHLAANADGPPATRGRHRPAVRRDRLPLRRRRHLGRRLRHEPAHRRGAVDPRPRIVPGYLMDAELHARRDERGRRRRDLGESSRVLRGARVSGHAQAVLRVRRHPDLRRLRRPADQRVAANGRDLPGERRIERRVLLVPDRRPEPRLHLLELSRRRLRRLGRERLVQHLPHRRHRLVHTIASRLGELRRALQLHGARQLGPEPT